MVADWAEFDRIIIERDLEIAIARRGEMALVRDIAKPVVLCLFDDGQQGKTILASLLAVHGIAVFSTDCFVARLRDSWHNEDRLRELAWQAVPQCVNEFMRQVETDANLAKEFLDLFFHAEHGFNSKAPISVIEGLLHHNGVSTPAVRLDIQIAQRLQTTGYRVWLSTRFRGIP